MAESARESHAEQPHTADKTILVVDDDYAVRTLTCRALAHEGYHVISAASGNEALRIVQENRDIDLLVTDVIMPGISGRELAVQIRRLKPSLRVLCLSGYMQLEYQKEGSELLPLPFLMKPFTPTMLRSKVREVLEAA